MNTRTSTQARSHAQKFFVKLEKKNLRLEDYLETLDLNDMGKSLLFSDLEDDEEDDQKSFNDRESRKSDSIQISSKQLK